MSFDIILAKLDAFQKQQDEANAELYTMMNELKENQDQMDKRIKELNQLFNHLVSCQTTTVEKITKLTNTLLTNFQ